VKVSSRAEGFAAAVEAAAATRRTELAVAAAGGDSFAESHRRALGHAITVASTTRTNLYRGLLLTSVPFPEIAHVAEYETMASDAVLHQALVREEEHHQQQQEHRRAATSAVAASPEIASVRPFDIDGDSTRVSARTGADEQEVRTNDTREPVAESVCVTIAHDDQEDTASAAAASPRPTRPVLSADSLHLPPTLNETGSAALQREGEDDHAADGDGARAMSPSVNFRGQSELTHRQFRLHPSTAPGARRGVVAAHLLAATQAAAVVEASPGGVALLRTLTLAAATTGVDPTLADSPAMDHNAHTAAAATSPAITPRPAAKASAATPVVKLSFTDQRPATASAVARAADAGVKGGSPREVVRSVVQAAEEAERRGRLEEAELDLCDFNPVAPRAHVGAHHEPTEADADFDGRANDGVPGDDGFAAAHGRSPRRGGTVKAATNNSARVDSSRKSHHQVGFQVADVLMPLPAPGDDPRGSFCFQAPHLGVTLLQAARRQERLDGTPRSMEDELLARHQRRAPKAFGLDPSADAPFRLAQSLAQESRNACRGIRDFLAQRKRACFKQYETAYEVKEAELRAQLRAAERRAAEEAAVAERRREEEEKRQRQAAEQKRKNAMRQYAASVAAKAAAAATAVATK
jgi:hypothetical protein